MKKVKRILNNQQGMSLVEVIAAAAISVIISAAVMKTNESGIKGINAVTTKMSLNISCLYLYDCQILKLIYFMIYATVLVLLILPDQIIPL